MMIREDHLNLRLTSRQRSEQKTDLYKSVYFWTLHSAANSAAAPAAWTVRFRCDSANESAIMASQARQRRPRDQSHSVRAPVIRSCQSPQLQDRRNPSTAKSLVYDIVECATTGQFARRQDLQEVSTIRRYLFLQWLSHRDSDACNPGAIPQPQGPSRCPVSGHKMKWAWQLPSHLHVEPKLPRVLPCQLGPKYGLSMQFSLENCSSIPITLRASCSAQQWLWIKQRAPPAPDERYKLIIVQHNLCQNSILELEGCSSRGQKGGRGKQSNTSHTEATIADGEASLYSCQVIQFTIDNLGQTRTEQQIELHKRRVVNTRRGPQDVHNGRMSYRSTKKYQGVMCLQQTKPRHSSASSLHLSSRMSSINIGAPNEAYTVLLAVRGFRRSWNQGDWPDPMTSARTEWLWSSGQRAAVSLGMPRWRIRWRSHTHTWTELFILLGGGGAAAEFAMECKVSEIHRLV